MQQAIRSTPEQIRRAQRRRKSTAPAAPRPRRYTIGQILGIAAGYVVATAFIAAVILGWAAGIDSWGFWR